VILLAIGGLILLYTLLTFKSKKEKEYEARLKKSLEDEFIIDPETGTKLTLEQAESGHWLNHDNEFRTVPNSEIEKLPTDEHRQAERALNYLRNSKTYLKTEISEEQFDILAKTKTLNSYDDWSYSNPFKFDKGLLFLPAPELHGITYYQDDYIESHIMFWIKIDSINGHYFFREKSSSEKFLDLLRNDDDIQLTDYECFTIKKSYNIIQLKAILNHFENQKSLEIEIDNDNLFIKSTKLISINDIHQIERIIDHITN